MATVNLKRPISLLKMSRKGGGNQEVCLKQTPQSDRFRDRRNERFEMNTKSKTGFLLTAWVLAAFGTAEAEQLTTLVQKIQPAVATVVAYDMDHNIANIGTGFFVDTEGHLITNHHVLAGKYAAEVRTRDGETYPVTAIVAENKSADLLKVRVDIPRNEIWPIRIGSELPTIAERVVVVGSPMGLEQTVSEGIVSSIREIPGVGQFFQISAPISPGSSGSPVVNRKGEVIGVATFQFVQGQNLNFAVSGRSILDLRSREAPRTVSEWTYHNSRNKPGLAAELCRKGYSFTINGENRKALQFFQKATEIAPDDPGSWSGLGYCYAGLEDHASAISAYKRAIHSDPENTFAHLQLGNYYRKLGQAQEAIAAYREAIRLDPDSEAAHFNLGVLLAGLGRLDAGKEEFETVIRINPNSLAAHFNVGLTYSKLGRAQDAIRAHESALRINPKFVPSHYSLGMIYGELGRPEQEIGAYKDALRIDPEFAPAHYQLGLAFLRRGQRQIALDQYKILKDLDEKMANDLFDRIYE
jgi:tetratricopeptide (TPR) repeat protein/V8-like Glu-specific endopeptidase